MRIDRLQDGTQWLIWKFQMRQILEAGKMYDVVTGDESLPDLIEVAAAEGVPANDNRAEIQTWREKDAKARRTIAVALGRQPTMQILNCETAKEMWTTLKGIYEQSSQTNIVFLQQKYYAFTKESGDDIATFLSKLMEIVQQMGDQNEAVSNSMVIAKILMALPAEYNHFHSACESTAAADRTMANLRTRLLTEELRLKSQGKVEKVEAFVAKKSFSKKGNAKKDGQSSKQYGKSNKEAKPKGTCFACGEKGHWRRDCKKNKTDSKRDERTSSDAFVCMASTSTGEKDAWLMDSAASDHMSHRRDWFQDFKEISSTVTIGNGMKIMAKGRGNINILAFNDNEWIQRQIRDVLYVPEMHINLFSSGRVMDHGHQLRSNSKRCEILKDGNIVAVGVGRDALYQMLFKVVETAIVDVAMANVAIKKVSLQSWHERMEHQPHSATRKEVFAEKRHRFCG